MNQDRRLRIGAGALLMAIFIRLISAGFFYPQISLFSGEKAAKALLFLGTGWHFRSLSPQEPTAPAPSPDPTFPTEGQTPVEKPAFSPEDAALVSWNHQCSLRPDAAALLCAPLSWELTGEAPTVLILSSHATESYTGQYEASGSYRTLDPQHNMLYIGAALQRILEQAGISVLRDQALHDHPSYNAAYGNSRASAAEYLQQYPSIRLVIDLHRDAAATTSGQLVTSATVGGQRSAQLMLVVGTDDNGNYHPHWQENLSLALKLQVLLEQENPGICRPLWLRAQQFNQDLSPGSILVEVGAAGNTREEALIAVTALGQAILQLAGGT